MAKSFSLDLSRLIKAVERSPQAAARGANNALREIKDDWVRESVDIAPLDTGNLRRQIHGEVINTGLNGIVEVHANATQATGKRFNYAYYIHEQDAGGRSLKLASAEKKFLDVVLERKRGEYQRWLEEEVMRELEQEGW